MRYGEESLSGKIAWVHSSARDEISLASPLGNQLALIVREPAGVVAAGRPTHVSEAGWEIDFDYDGEARLPRRLVMVFSRAERPLEIRLVIDAWS